MTSYKTSAKITAILTTERQGFMTMHLVGPYLTTTNYGKRKSKKPTQKQLEKYILEMKAYNKRMRQIHAHDQQMTLDEYIDYVHGHYTPRKKEQKFEPYVEPRSYQRETQYIPSLGDGVGNGLLKERPVYTGTLIKGIATMHKSNAVPVIDDQQAKDIAQMRRN